MKIEEALAWIHSRLPFGIRPGLIRVEALLAKVGNPHEKLKIIHIAGTNGKGSTVAYLRSLLEEVGLTVGSYTSPYIESFNERIAINGKPIADDALIQYVERYQTIVAELDADPEVKGITEFEVLTAMAFEYFVAQQVDVAIVEVGLGGLLDSTNVVTPKLTAITTIGLDHTDILGDTLEEIAAQKAGIIKENIPVVTGSIDTVALAVIDDVAQKKQAPVYHFKKEYETLYKHPDKSWGEVFDFIGTNGKITNLKTPLLGRHQVENAGLAIQLFQLYCAQIEINWTDRNVREGLAKTAWPARMEKLNDQPLIILDGAHNDHAMKRLVENMKKEFSNYRINILFSAITTKDINGMIKMLAAIPNSHIYLTTFDYPKALDLANFSNNEYPNVTFVSLWQFGLAEIMSTIGEDEMLLVTGSLYFTSKVRELLIGLDDEEK
jgi:dihydrofolate synthase/folylpolyglutamate synthase